MEETLVKNQSAMPPLIRQVRWWIMALLFFVTVINFVDRLTLSFVAPVLRDTFHLSNQQYGFIVGSFVFGMMIGEFPMGWVMDRKGPRAGFTFAVLWWSLANAMHALGRAAWHFSLFRFWLGTGECANFPGAVKVVGQWFPARERAFAIGTFNGATLIGSMIAGPLVVYIMTRFNWQAAFLIPSILGAFWVFFWLAFYRPPERHPSLTEAEREYIKAGQEAEVEEVGSLRLLDIRQAWAVMLCRLLVGPVIQFYLFWLPEYLFRVRGFEMKSIAWFSVLPPLFGDLGSIGGGLVAGMLIARGRTVTSARKIVMFSGAALCAMSIIVVTAPSPVVCGAAICLVYLGHYALSANMFAAITDLFPNSATARATALTGIAGGFSGWLFPIITGKLVDAVSFTPVFFIASMMPAAGVLALFLLAGQLRRVEI
jgi:ACS family hexuronate transporter-like MFS transporter